MTKPASYHDQNYWIEPLEAVHFVGARVGGDAAAKKAILERLKDGAIDATAAWFASAVDVGRPYIPPVLSFEYDEGELPPQRSATELRELFLERAMPTVSATRYGDGLAFAADRGSSLLIGGMFWGGVSKADFKRWDWSQGFCISSFAKGTWTTPQLPIEVSSRFPMRMFALGVKFRRSDIFRIGVASDNAAMPIIPALRGRKLSDKWPEWVAEVVLLSEQEGILGLSANALIEKIANRLAEKGISAPATGTVTSAAQAIVATLETERRHGRV